MGLYEGLPIVSENLLVITWILTSSPNFHCHLQSSHLLLVYNDPSNFAIFGSTHWSLPALLCLVPIGILLGYEILPFQSKFHFREHGELTGGQVRWARRVRISGHAIFCQEFPHNEWGVCRRIVMVQKPLSFLPHLRLFAPHIFPQSPQNLTVKIPIDILTRWNKLIMHNSSNVIIIIIINIYIYIYKNDQHWFDVATNLACFFHLRRGWCLPLWKLLLCFWVIIVQPWFITSYNSVREVMITSNCFLQLGAHLNPMVLLVIVQETRNKLSHNSSHVQFTRYNVLTWFVWQSNMITNNVDSLSSRITSCTLAIISRVVHVDGRPEHVWSSTDSRPPSKCLNHSNVLAWLKACSPKASFSIRWVSVSFLLSLKQKFNANSLLHNIHHFHISTYTWKRCKENSQISDTRALMKTQIG